MRPVNIFRVSRIHDEGLFNISVKHEAEDHDNHRIKIHEIDSLRILVDALTDSGVSISELDGFYLGFIIPQIGKEFDLLKVTGRNCLNIELKSQDVTEENILAQLRKNHHYLTLLGKKLMLFTVVTDTLTCYRLSRKGNLVRTELSEIAEAVRECDSTYEGRIDRLFRASEYLISPDKAPDKFLLGQYFLTPAQDYVKSELFKGISSEHYCAFFHITGRPCTGKTLLIYDLAKQLAVSGRTLIVCRGEPSEGLKIISRAIDNLDFMSADSVCTSSELDSYDFILVDESHRLSNAAFEALCDSAEKNGQICIFSTDPDAVLTNDEKERNIAGRIRTLGLSGEFELSEKLRMNMEIYTFIMKLKHLNFQTDRTYDYDDITVNYANNVSEAYDLIQYFRRKGFIFINACHGRRDEFEECEEHFGSEHIIGREYDKVVMLMDSYFHYDEDGFLKGIIKPDSDSIYPNIFYQGISRVRERLALVILDAPELLRSILTIID